MKNTCFLLLTLFISLSVTGQTIFGKGKSKIDKFKNEKAINDFHKSNFGNILFSLDRIPFEANHAANISSVEYGKELFVREYWTQTMTEAYKEALNGKGGMDIALLYIVKINGKSTFEKVYYDHSGKDASETWYTNWFVASKPSSTKSGFLYNTIIDEALAQNKSSLKSNNLIVIESYIYDASTSKKGKLMAKGEINILLPNTSLVEEISDLAYPSCMEKPKMKDKNLEKQFISEMNNQGWKETFTHAIINKDDYTIIRNQLTSIIEGRTLGADMASRNGDKCMSQRFTFYQAHDGSTFSGKWKMHGVGEQTKLNCNCLKN